MRALGRVRRPALANLEIETHVLPVTWRGTQAMLGKLWERAAPDAIVMFGLAGSARSIRVETRAVNAANRLRADAEGRTATRAALLPGGPSAMRSRVDARRVLASIRASGASGARAVISVDAGTYLCNAALWSALTQADARTAVLFIHVPPVARRVPVSRARKRPTQSGLVRAAVAALTALKF